MIAKEVHWPGWETAQLLGSGSFGVVYEIQRQNDGVLERAALKVISIPQNSSDIDDMYSEGYDEESITLTFRNHLESVIAEYSLMQKMSGSANVVHCDDIRYVQHSDGIGWDILIKMELLTPLMKKIDSNVSEATVLKLGRDICGALEQCKLHGIVHRDIKPQNIFVAENGNFKLGDFGIAKTIEGTMGGTKIGTYKYMAPEVYNNRPYGSSADIYSLGLVLYWLLNERRLPFMPLPPAKLTAGMEEKARQRRMAGEPLPAPAHGSAELKRIVLKACAYNQKDRYNSATQMLRDLELLACKVEVQAAANRTSGFVCQRCGTVVPAHLSFCGRCGTPVRQQYTNISQQRPVQPQSAKPVQQPVRPQYTNAAQPRVVQPQPVKPVQQPVRPQYANAAQPRVVQPQQAKPVQQPARPQYTNAAQQTQANPQNVQYYGGAKHNGKVGFFKAIALFFKNYVNFKGRASRSEYWWAYLFNTIVSIPISLIAEEVPVLGGLLAFALILPGISLSVRRLHDSGTSGAYWFMGLIPFAGSILLLVKFFKGSDGNNRWGPGPM